MESSLGFIVDAVLPAGGTGQRMGLEMPKQFHKIYGRCLICYALDIFESIPWIRSIAVPVSNDWKSFMIDLIRENNYTKILVADGKSTRHRSICEGVLSLKRDNNAPDVVIIHDAVRPLVDEKTLREVAIAAKNHGASGAVRPLISTVVVKDETDCMDYSLNRSRCRSSEMPQGFRYDIIVEAYNQTSEDEFEHGTECLQLAKSYMGASAKLVDGPETLWKVTHQKDIHTLERVLEDQMKMKVFVHKSSNKQNHLYQNVIAELRRQGNEVFETSQNGVGIRTKNVNMAGREEEEIPSNKQKFSQKQFLLLFLDHWDDDQLSSLQVNDFSGKLEIIFLIYPGNTTEFQQINQFIRKGMHKEKSIPFACGVAYNFESIETECSIISKRVLDLLNIVKKHGPILFDKQIFTY